MEQVKDQINVSALTRGATFLNDILSFIVFTLLDLLDFILCYAYKVADFLVESEWKPCYCSSSKEAITTCSRVSDSSNIVRLTCTTKVLRPAARVEEISDTLYARPSLVSEVSKSTIVRSRSNRHHHRRTTYTVDSTVMEMLRGRIKGKQSLPVPRWSDCDCETCTAWACSSTNEKLFVKADGAIGN